jgi:hypothetical protein
MVVSLMTFRERGIVVAVMSNISYADTSDLALKVAEAIRGAGETSGTVAVLVSTRSIIACSGPALQAAHIDPVVALRERRCFVIPNPWDVGSARYLQHLGFPALAGLTPFADINDFSQRISRPVRLA